MKVVRTFLKHFGSGSIILESYIYHCSEELIWWLIFGEIHRREERRGQDPLLDLHIYRQFEYWRSRAPFYDFVFFCCFSYNLSPILSWGINCLKIYDRLFLLEVLVGHKKLLCHLSRSPNVMHRARAQKRRNLSMKQKWCEWNCFCKSCSTLDLNVGKVDVYWVIVFI